MNLLPYPAGCPVGLRVGAGIYPEISVEISGKFQSRRGNHEKCGAPISTPKFFRNRKRFLSLQQFYSAQQAAGRLACWTDSRIFRVNLAGRALSSPIIFLWLRVLQQRNVSRFLRWFFPLLF